MYYLILFAGIVLITYFFIVQTKHNGNFKIARGISSSDYPYVRKKYLFDNYSEYQFFKILQEIVDDKYLILPQMNYSHIIDVKNMSYFQMRKFRTKIDKKSADYVICDKESVQPKLVIELDGNSHSKVNRIKRDEWINNLCSQVGLPITHILVSELGNKEEINRRIKDLLN
jgi:very-short-patch-repair endonuclease